MKTITTFRGDYSFLSNFSPFESPMNYDGDIYRSNEHFYQAMKTLDKGSRTSVSLHPKKGLKQYAKTLELRPDWEDIKYKVMLFGLRYKFSMHNPWHRQNLINTGDDYISEGNWWGDTYWGVDIKTGVGENMLGKLLMQVRGEAIMEIDNNVHCMGH